MDVSLAKCFVIGDKFLAMSWIYMKKKGVSKIKPWGTPTVIGNHIED